MQPPEYDAVSPSSGQPRLRIDVTTYADRTEVGLCGDLDIATSQLLIDAVSRHDHQPGLDLHIDLSQVEIMDSSGLQALLVLREQTMELDGDTSFTPGPRRVQRVFELCGLQDVLTFTPDGRPNG